MWVKMKFEEVLVINVLVYRLVRSFLTPSIVCVCFFCVRLLGGLSFVDLGNLLYGCLVFVVVR